MFFTTQKKSLYNDYKDIGIEQESRTITGRDPDSPRIPPTPIVSILKLYGRTPFELDLVLHLSLTNGG